jgi:asparagine synthase (glutamine-hydrolysing)
LPDDLLIKADKMTMTASVELRVPLPGQAVVEFCLRLPDALKLRSGCGKHLLKPVALQWLPPSIVYRKAQGFATPVGRWSSGPVAGTVRQRPYGWRGCA